MKRMMWLAAVAIAAPCVFAETIAYWPMNVTVNGDSRTVADVSGNGYTLDVRAADKGGSDFADSDTGWTLPPNPDAKGAPSPQMLQSANENESVTANFTPVLSINNRPLKTALLYENEFTLEGWFRATALPTAGNSALNKFIFAFNALGSAGGWSWYFFSSKKDEYDMRIEYNEGKNAADPSQYDRKTLTFCKLRGDEVLNQWNHYALVCRKASDTQAELCFYRNGVLRGSGLVALPHDVGTPSSTFNISGASSGANKQAMIGDLTCWRASDAALAPNDFLTGNDSTISYLTMTPDGTNIRSAVDPMGDFGLRAASLGGVESVASDIGWTRPPNPDGQACSVRSEAMLRMSTGALDGTVYRPIVTAVNGAALMAVVSQTNSFTVEGWYRMKTAPASAKSNYMFAYATLGTYGGWAWNIFGADENGECAIKMDANQDRTGRNTIEVARVRLGEVLDTWCHYALAYDAEACRWTFYLNGARRGSAVGKYVHDIVFGSNASFNLFGCGSGTAQIPIGDVTTWRISRGALAPERLLCGAGTDPTQTYVWTGAADATWKADAKTNWKIEGEGTAVAWKNGQYARFDDTSETTAITLAGEVNPRSVTADVSRDVKVTVGSSAFIGANNESFVKKGTGTFWVETAVDGKPINKSVNTVDVQAGTLRLSCVNQPLALGDATLARGYEVFVRDGATLWIDRRNAIGSADFGAVNGSHITVFTNGTFDLSFDEAAHAGDTFSIQAIGTLDLLGGTLVLPSTGHSSGTLQIQDRVWFGKNPSKTPYVIAAAPRSTDDQAWRVCADTECRVDDITEDAEPDVVFYNHLLVTTNWANGAACGFHKTGAGTMALRQDHKGHAAALTYPNGLISVAEGELRIDCDYRDPSFAVASGAFLSGTGMVSAVTFADGAGLRATAGQAFFLTVDGDCELGAAGTVEIRNPNKRHRAKLLKVNGTVTGGENLVNWTVKVDGEVSDDYRLILQNGELTAKEEWGGLLIVR